MDIIIFQSIDKSFLTNYFLLTKNKFEKVYDVFTVGSIIYTWCIINFASFKNFSCKTLLNKYIKIIIFFFFF